MDESRETNRTAQAGLRTTDSGDPSGAPSDETTPIRALRIDIVTLFPAMFTGPFDHSMIARARAAGLLDLRVHDLRHFTHDRHRTADDYAYGGGGGMVMKPEPLFEAVESILAIPPLVPGAGGPPHPVILMSPQGEPFDHGIARSLASFDRLVVIAGHYEGVDERVREHLVTRELSVGDFVVTGGELPAMLVVDAVARLRPGVVGGETATRSDSFAEGVSGRLEHPHYTRPPDFRGWRVPEILVSGHHGEVERWRRRASLERTWQRRPDLIEPASLSDEERRWIESIEAETRPRLERGDELGARQGEDHGTARGVGGRDRADQL